MSRDSPAPMSVRPSLSWKGLLLALGARVWLLIGWIWSTIILGGLLVSLLITYATTGTILDPRSWALIRTLLAHPTILVLGLLLAFLLTLGAYWASRLQRQEQQQAFDFQQTLQSIEQHVHHLDRESHPTPADPAPGTADPPPASLSMRTPPAPTPSIRTPDQRLRVFLSSTLEELAPERRAAREAISGLHLTPVFFEAGARPYPPRELYRAYLAQSDLFLGIYWQRYGWVAPNMDISGLEDEYRLSQGKPRLIYVKEPAPQREQELQTLLDRIRTENVTTYQKFSTAAELQELVANDLAQVLTDHFTRPAEPLTSPSAQFAPLPIIRSPLINRTHELAQAHDLLLRQDVGLVTITGPGGVGKTRLAIQVATSIAAHFANGAAFISLAPLKDADQVVPTIAHALHVSGEQSRPLAESLLEYLRNSHLLLVLDNIEQVISVAPQLAQMLEYAPQLKVLLTSREPLQIRGEWTVPVPPLALPEPAHLPDLQTLGQIPAVALFLERAREVDAGFALTHENAQAIAEICQRLDGLPLALELAAARINVLPPRLLLARLGHRLPLLTHGARDLPERQQTLRTTIAWSYDLLSPEEQRLFRSLAVFTGGFSTDAATALESARPADPQAELEQQRDEMLDRLESLVSKNLLRVEQGFDGAPRFSMLATIQEYAQEQLEAHGEQAAVQERCVQFFLTLAQTAEPQPYPGERDAWMERLESEDANLRAALTWCKEHSQAVQIGLRLAGALSFFWFLSGNAREGRSWLDTMLAQTAASDGSNARGRALYGAGLLALEQGDTDVAAQDAEEALSIFREGGETLWRGYAQLLLGTARMSQGHVVQARPLLEECLSIFKELKSPWGEALTLFYLGIDAELGEKRAEALANYQESFQRFQHMHDVLYSCVVLSALVGVIAHQGDNEAAHALSEQLVQQASHRWMLGTYLLAKGESLQHTYKLYGNAKMLYQGGLRLWQDIERVENGMGIIRGLVGLAEIAAIQGQGARAG
jgi:predicted ATPase